MQIFKANKGNFLIVIVLSLIIPLFILLDRSFTSDWFSNGIVLLAFIPFALLIWIYFSTKYAIIDEEFHYQSAFVKGKIPVAKIKKIQKNKTLWAGVKPAMAKNGLIIQYGFDEVYVAPKDSEALIKELLAVNPDIVIES